MAAPKFLNVTLISAAVHLPDGLDRQQIRGKLQQAAQSAALEVAEKVIAERFDREAWAEACKQHLLEGTLLLELPDLESFPVKDKSKDDAADEIWARVHRELEFKIGLLGRNTSVTGF